MKSIWYWLALSLLFVSQALYAGTKVPPDDYGPQECDIQGQNYAEISFVVVGRDNFYQDVFVTNQGGNQRRQTLWYTEDYINSDDHIFNEQSLKHDVYYQILLVNKVANNSTGETGGSRYYRKNLTAGNEHWQLIEESSKSMQSGKLSVRVEGQIGQVECITSETVPEVPEIELDICAYTPDSAQTNDYYNGYPRYNSSLNISSSGNFLYIPQANPKLSFAKVQQTSNNCNYGGQQVDCEIDPRLTFDNYPPELESYDTSDSNVYHDYTCPNDCNLKPGKYRNITLKMNGTLTLESGSYYFNELNFSEQNTKIALKDNKPVEIHYKKINFGADNITLNSGGRAENLLLIGHGRDSRMDIGGQNTNINGYVYVDPKAGSDGFKLSGTNITVAGGVSAASVNILGGGNHKVGQSNSGRCFNPDVEEDNYTLILSPVSDIALVCEEITPTLSVMSDGALATDFSGSASVTVNSVTRIIKIENGTAAIPLTSGGSSGTISVSASLPEYPDTASVSGSYQFVPYKLSAENQYVIANKPVQVTAIAQACNDGGDVVDIGYNGKPEVQSSWVAPIGGIGGLTYSPEFSNGQSISELILVESGEHLVTMSDSEFSCSGENCPIEQGTLKGQFTVYSRPWTFAICSPSGRDMSGNISDADSAAFTAAGNPFELAIRPLRWVPQADNSDPMNGSQAIETSAYCGSPVTQNFFSNAEALQANVQLSHDVAEPSGGERGSLSGLSVLSNSDTNNDTDLPFSELAWSEVGVLRVTADTQANYLGMNVNPGYRDIGRFYPAWLSLMSNDWNYADGHDNFMYMDQPVSYDFVVEAQNMQGGATSNYSQFSPALISNVQLLAVDTADDNADLSNRVESYASQLWDGSSGWSGAQLQVENQDFKFTRFRAETSPLKTTSDGPYTDGFGLYVTTPADGVDFNVSQGSNLELINGETVTKVGKAFPTQQPDIRYGRMVMEDVGGTSVSTIKIPLRVDYWDGSRFTTNTDDSGSSFVTLADYVCRQRLWSDSEIVSTAALTGGDSSTGKKVTAGLSDELLATPHSSSDSSSLREQIRFWLRVDDSTTKSPQILQTEVSCGSSYSSQPWLQYNWRNLGDEDPSAVVTFGIHRGNDRIIYRGEPNLTGQ